MNIDKPGDNLPSLYAPYLRRRSRATSPQSRVRIWILGKNNRIRYAGNFEYVIVAKLRDIFATRDGGPTLVRVLRKIMINMQRDLVVEYRKNRGKFSQTRSD